MVTKLMVIQKINLDGDVEVFQVTGDYFQWTFETRRAKDATDKGYYPFVIDGEARIWTRKPGAETKLAVKSNEITFVDDYGVPEGTAIGILFPSGFIPDIIKFKDKPYIPVGLSGLTATRSPGHIQVLYNHFEQQSAIIFNITDNIAFGFKCLAKKVSKSKFPKNDSIYAEDLFDVSLSRDFLNVKAIHTDDLKIINETVADKSEIAGLNELMNELLEAVKSNHSEKSQALLTRIGSMLTNAVGTASGISTLADSYLTGGATFQFIHKILKYTGL